MLSFDGFPTVSLRFVSGIGFSLKLAPVSDILESKHWLETLLKTALPIDKYCNLMEVLGVHANQAFMKHGGYHG